MAVSGPVSGLSVCQGLCQGLLGLSGSVSGLSMASPAQPIACQDHLDLSVTCQRPIIGLSGPACGLSGTVRGLSGPVSGLSGPVSGLSRAW